jgi:hypothetical protein
MNQLLMNLIEQTDALALQKKVLDLKRLALDQFRALPPHEQSNCLAALENGEVPGTADFVWTCIVQAGLGEIALMDFLDNFSKPEATIAEKQGQSV